MRVGGQPEAEPELRVVLEQRVGPRRTPPVGVGGPRRGGQVAAVDRRAAGRVGDHQPVTEELREQLEVGRLAAPRTRAGELEQRLQELRAAHGAEVHAGPVVGRQGLEKGDVVSLRGQPRLAGSEIDRLGPGGARNDDRAGLHTQAAPGAVLDVHLQRIPGVRQPDGVQRRRVELLRRTRQLGLVVVLRPDHAVRADEAAVAALNTAPGIPDRHQFGNVAFLIRGGATGVGAIHRKCADRQGVSAPGHHLRGHGAHELRRILGHCRYWRAHRGGQARHLDAV